jgi:hypothetical protein
MLYGKSARDRSNASCIHNDRKTDALVSHIAVLTGFGSWLLYSKVEEDGCDPSGSVPGNRSCPSTGADVFGAMLGTLVGIFASMFAQNSPYLTLQVIPDLLQVLRLLHKVSVNSETFRRLSPLLVLPPTMRSR